MKSMPKEQFGFIPMANVDLCKIKAVKQIKSRLENKEKCYGVFLDFSSAYDRVDRGILYELVQKHKVLRADSLQLLKFIHARLNVVIGQSTAKMTSGIPQGLMSSPALFDVYTIPIILRLKEIGIRTIIFYADDLLLICESQKQIKQAIICIKEWC